MEICDAQVISALEKLPYPGLFPTVCLTAFIGVTKCEKISTLFTTFHNLCFFYSRIHQNLLLLLYGWDAWLNFTHFSKRKAKDRLRTSPKWAERKVLTSIGIGENVNLETTWNCSYWGRRPIGSHKSSQGPISKSAKEENESSELNQGTASVKSKSISRCATSTYVWVIPGLMWSFQMGSPWNSADFVTTYLMMVFSLTLLDCSLRWWHAGG